MGWRPISRTIHEPNLGPERYTITLSAAGELLRHHYGDRQLRR